MKREAAAVLDRLHDRGACARVDDPDIFFPPRGSNGIEAKRVCATCRVRDECLDYALDYGEKYGIWGGLNREERAAVKRTRRVA